MTAHLHSLISCEKLQLVKTSVVLELSSEFEGNLKGPKHFQEIQDAAKYNEEDRQYLQNKSLPFGMNR